MRSLLTFLCCLVISFVSLFCISAVSVATETQDISKFSCGSEKDKRNFVYSRNGRYLICANDGNIHVFSVFEKNGISRRFDLPLFSASELISIVGVTQNEQYTVFLVKTRGVVDAHQQPRGSLYVGENKTGAVKEVTRTLSKGCSVAWAKLSPNGDYAAYAVMGVKAELNADPTLSKSFGCESESTGYFVYNLQSKQVKKLSNEMPENAVVYPPRISADSKKVVFSGNTLGNYWVKDIAKEMPPEPIGAKLRKSDLGPRGQFNAMGMVGGEYLHGRMFTGKHSDKKTDEVSMHDTAWLIAVPLNGSDSVMELAYSDIDKGTFIPAHSWVAGSPSGEYLTYFQNLQSGLTGLYSIASKGGKPILLHSSRSLEIEEPVFVDGGKAIIFEAEDRIYFAKLDGAEHLIYDTRQVEGYENREPIKLARSARNKHVTKVHNGRLYFMAEHLGENCPKRSTSPHFAPVGLYSVPLGGGKVKSVLPKTTQDCYVIDYAFSQDGKSVIYVSKTRRKGNGYRFHKADIDDYSLQTHIASIEK